MRRLLVLGATILAGATAFAAPPPQGARDTTAVGPATARWMAEGAVALTRPEELDAAKPAAGRCANCHPRERTDFARGLHAREGVRCVSCHHGNDVAFEAAGAHAGLVAKPPRAAIADLCGSCHSDPARMGPYSLPVDQVALYRTSGHGRSGSATCIDCHGAHESLPASDVRSMTSAANRDLVCARCHSTPTAGGHNVMAEWRGSVHGTATGRAPGCTACHGVHGATPAAAGDISKVCGQCHQAERRAIESGGHARTATTENAPGCATCHGQHAIHAQSPDSLAASCGGCHRPGTREEQLGKSLWNEYRDARRSVDAAAALVARADAIPVPTEDYRARLHDALASLQDARPASHAVALEPVREAAHQARAAGDEVQASVRHKLGLVSERWLMLAVFWLFSGLLLVVLHRWRVRGRA